MTSMVSIIITGKDETLVAGSLQKPVLTGFEQTWYRFLKRSS